MEVYKNSRNAVGYFPVDVPLLGQISGRKTEGYRRKKVDRRSGFPKRNSLVLEWRSLA